MRNYTTQLLKDITDKMDLIAGEEEIDYFSYLRGSDITEGMHCGGYKEAIANALSAANAFEHEIRKDAEEAKAKLTAIFLEAERADVQCYMTLREVSETLKDWMLLAQKLRLSMTGGGGYGEQLFCENNIKQWTGETAARLEKESYSAEERAEDRNEAFLAGEYTGGMPSEIYEPIARANRAKQKIDEIILSMDPDIATEYLLPNTDLLVEVYTYTAMSEEEDDLFWDSICWLGTPYTQDYFFAEKGEHSDCGGFARGLYQENGIWVSLSGSGRPSYQMWNGAANSSEYYISRINSLHGQDRDGNGMDDAEAIYNGNAYTFLVKNGTTTGRVIYDKDNNDLSETEYISCNTAGIEYRTGDVFYYDLNSDADHPGVDHVGICLGHDMDGNYIFIETATTSKSSTTAPDNLEIIGPNHAKYLSRTAIQNIQGVRRYFDTDT